MPSYNSIDPPLARDQVYTVKKRFRKTVEGVRYSLCKNEQMVFKGVLDSEKCNDCYVFKPFGEVPEIFLTKEDVKIYISLD